MKDNQRPHLASARGAVFELLPIYPPSAVQTPPSAEQTPLGVASANGSPDWALTDLTRSGIGKLDGEALSNRAALVLAQANARKTELATLQVTQADIDELSQALQDYNEAKAGPRQVTAARVGPD
jgi:hypothetical protein